MGLDAQLSFVVSILGFVLISVLLYRHNQPSIRFLAFFVFTFAWGSFGIFLFVTRYYLDVPYLFRLGWLLLYVSAPCLLFYVRYLANEDRPLKWKDALHLIPALVYFIDFLPYYASSNEHKRQVLQAIFQNIPKVVLFREGWFMPPAFHILLRYGIGLGYAIYIALLLRNLKTPEMQKLMKNSAIRKWLLLLLIYFFLVNITGFAIYFFAFTEFAWHATFWNSLLIIAALAVTLLLRPDILYGNQLMKLIPKSKGSTQQDQFSNSIEEGLRQLIENRLYLQKNIKIKNLAEQFGVQPYVLSAYINSVYQMRFNDLINWCRIQYIRDGLESAKWTLLTLEGISEEAGFNNRTTFLAAFKKFTGVTPTAFAKGARDEMTEKKILSAANGVLTNLRIPSGIGEKDSH